MNAWRQALAQGRCLRIGHRGAAGLAPQNTLRAFRLAIELGVDAVELDVRQSADGELVVIHDEDVAASTDGQGLARDHTLAALSACPRWPRRWTASEDGRWLLLT